MSTPKKYGNKIDKYNKGQLIMLLIRHYCNINEHDDKRDIAHLTYTKTYNVSPTITLKEEVAIRGTIYTVLFSKGEVFTFLYQNIIASYDIVLANKPYVGHDHINHKGYSVDWFELILSLPIKKIFPNRKQRFVNFLKKF